MKHVVVVCPRRRSDLAVRALVREWGRLEPKISDTGAIVTRVFGRAALRATLRELLTIHDGHGAVVVFLTHGTEPDGPEDGRKAALTPASDRVLYRGKVVFALTCWTGEAWCKQMTGAGALAAFGFERQLFLRDDPELVEVQAEWLLSGVRAFLIEGRTLSGARDRFLAATVEAFNEFKGAKDSTLDLAGYAAQNWASIRADLAPEAGGLTALDYFG